MSNRNKFLVFPSRCNFVLFKHKINQAFRGSKLLRGKKDSLEIKLRAIRAENNKLREQLDVLLSDALFTLSQAKFIGWDSRSLSVQSPKSTSFFVSVTHNSVAGVKVPTYQIHKSDAPNFPLTGLGGGGQHVIQIREAFFDTLELIVKMAFLQSSENALKDAAYKSNIRLNGLEYVMLPKLQETLTYIASELEEIDREDTYRLKKSLQATIKRAKKKEQERLNREMANLLDEKQSSLVSLQDFYECLENNRAECETLRTVFRKGSIAEFFSAFDYFDPNVFGNSVAEFFSTKEDCEEGGLDEL